jgi:hypothetical protein
VQFSLFVFFKILLEKKTFYEGPKRIVIIVKLWSEIVKKNTIYFQNKKVDILSFFVRKFLCRVIHCKLPQISQSTSKVLRMESSPCYYFLLSSIFLFPFFS